jgi:hypothetical protein
MKEENWEYLTTTNDYRCVLKHVKEEKRKFVWYHFDGSKAKKEKEYTEYILNLYGWVIVKDRLPSWFLLAYRKYTHVKDIEKMINLIKPKESDEDIIWKGKQFGYPMKQIRQYLEEIKKHR